MSYCLCYFHFVWATKKRQPWLTPAVRMAVFETIRAKSTELSCRVHALNCVDDHIHVAVSLHSQVAVAQWAKHVKGASSYQVNHQLVDLPFHFQWQDTYAALSFGAKSLRFVTAYIENQQVHHAAQTLIPYLEYTGAPDEIPPAKLATSLQR